MTLWVYFLPAFHTWSRCLCQDGAIECVLAVMRSFQRMSSPERSGEREWVSPDAKNVCERVSRLTMVALEPCAIIISPMWKSIWMRYSLKGLSDYNPILLCPFISEPQEKILECQCGNYVSINGLKIYSLFYLRRNNLQTCPLQSHTNLRIPFTSSILT